jgi:anti-anti-sigma factor
MLDIHVGDNGSVVLAGRFDASQAAKAEAFFDAVSGAVVLDLKDLQYISSLGLGTLVRVEKRLRGSVGGGLTLINVSPHVRDVLAYAGLDMIFKIGPPPEK